MQAKAGKGQVVAAGNIPNIDDRRDSSRVYLGSFPNLDNRAGAARAWEFPKS
jgi:hypothetical protein